MLSRVKSDSLGTVNMIVHRDYRDSGNSIIKIFDDRIEFFNPGKLYDDITIEKLNSNDYSSRTRNRAVARAFKEAGIIEQYGSGIKRIKSECKLHGVIEPIFEEFMHGFRVILFKEKINVGINDLYMFIENNQPIRVSRLKEYFNKVTTRTLERWLKQLKDEDKIEYKGSKKTGGYEVK